MSPRVLGHALDAESSGVAIPDGAGTAPTATRCTADPAGLFTRHDHSQPPHNTPANPRDAESEGPCQAQSAGGPPWCQHERRYEIVIYQIGTHDWIRMYACVPCTASLRRRHANLGPGGIDGIAQITDASLPAQNADRSTEGGRRGHI